jgi:hypothetical protein
MVRVIKACRILRWKYPSGEELPEACHDPAPYGQEPQSVKKDYLCGVLYDCHAVCVSKNLFFEGRAQRHVPKEPEGFRSYCQNHCVKMLFGHRKAVIPEHEQKAFNGFFDIVNGFFAGLPLRNTSVQARAFCNPVPVFSGI